MGPDREELEACRSGFERSNDFRSDADRVEGSNLEELIVELDLSASAENHVDLFGACVSMCKRRPLARPKTEMRHACLLGVQSRAGHARLPIAAEVVPACGILDIAQIDLRVWGGHHPQFASRVMSRACRRVLMMRLQRAQEQDAVASYESEGVAVLLAAA
jgi:hypothetical protein